MGMTTLARLFVELYAHLLRLYPRSFCADFGEEMRVVFADAAAEAVERGGMAERHWPM